MHHSIPRIRAAIAALLCCATPGLASAETGPTALTTQGRIAGVMATPRVRAFLGVPFAAPPVGPLRWKAPQPSPAWRGIRDARHFAARCMQQPLFSDMMFRSPGISEDCLYLNIWAPVASAGKHAAKLPVLFYIHGGGFLAGDGSERRYDGASMAARGMVVITLNYRLGAFGFLAHPGLTTESPRHTSGNYGLLDQAAALAWARRNVAAFGGDPARITIGGESAGSMSVNALMASPVTRTGFARAIGESGAAMAPTIVLQSRAQAEQTGLGFATSVGATTVAALRALPAERLLTAQGEARGTNFEPIVDGDFLIETVADSFAAGRQAQVALLLGSNSQEGGPGNILGEAQPTVANYRAALTRLAGDKADALFALYPAASDGDVSAATTDLASDQFIAGSTWKWFDLHRRSGAPTYYYRYVHVRPAFVQAPPGAASGVAAGAVHSAEIEYALGNLDANPEYRWTDADRHVSAVIQGYFANFVITGNPNGAGLPAWPAAPRDEQPISRQIIDVDTRSAPFPEQARYRAAEALLPLR